jgi:hypothetical protein
MADLYNELKSLNPRLYKKAIETSECLILNSRIQESKLASDIEGTIVAAIYEAYKLGQENALCNNWEG